MNKSTVGAVCSSMHSGGTPSTKHPEYWGGEFPWLSSSESGNDYINSATQFISQEGIDNSATKLAKRDSVLIATAGEGKTRGQVSYLNIDAYINQSLIAMQANQSIVYPKFLYYYLKNSYAKLRSLSDITGVRGSLSGSLLKEFNIQYPSLSEQKSIVNCLSSIDAQIANNNAICAELESMAKLLYDYWFVQFDFPDENGRSYKASGGKMVWNKELKREIPEGWTVGHLSDYELFVGGTPSRKNIKYWDDGDIPWLKTEEINNGIIEQSEEYISSDGLHNSAAKIIPADSVIMAMYGKGTAGRIGYLSYPATTNQACCSIVLQNKVEAAFVYFTCKELWDYINLIITGSIQQNLSKEAIGNLAFVKPSFELMEQTGFSSLVSEMIHISNLNHDLKNLRDFLLPMLMNGQVKVGN